MFYIFYYCTQPCFEQLLPSSRKHLIYLLLGIKVRLDSIRAYARTKRQIYCCHSSVNYLQIIPFRVFPSVFSLYEIFQTRWSVRLHIYDYVNLSLVWNIFNFIFGIYVVSLAPDVEESNQNESFKSDIDSQYKSCSL